VFIRAHLWLSFFTASDGRAAESALRRCQAITVTNAPHGRGSEAHQRWYEKAGLAVVAVARKLAVLLHALWSRGKVYDPHYNRKAAKGKGQIAA